MTNAYSAQYHMIMNPIYSYMFIRRAVFGMTLLVFCKMTKYSSY